MVIDAHVHFWDAARADDILIVRHQPSLQRSFLPADLLTHLQHQKIDQCVVVQSAPVEAETRFLFSLVNDLPWVHGVVGWVDIEAHDLAQRLEQLVTLGPLVGVRLMLNRIDDARWITRATVLQGLRVLAQANLTLDLIVLQQHIDPVCVALDQVPALRVVINHAATPSIASNALQPWKSLLTRLAAQTQAVCKFSGLREVAGPQPTVAQLEPYARHLLDSFGPSRLLFASNWPVCDLVGGYTAWYEDFHDLIARCGLGPLECAAILGANAEQAYPRQPSGVAAFERCR